MSDYTHCVVTTIDGYYDKHASQKVKIEKHVKVDHSNTLAEFIKCLDLAKVSDEVVIKLKGKNGQPFLITKEWTESKEDFGRR